MSVCLVIYIPRIQLCPIFEGQPPKTRPFQIKARVIWVPGIYFKISTPLSGDPREFPSWLQSKSSRTKSWQLPTSHEKYPHPIESKPRNCLAFFWEENLGCGVFYRCIIFLQGGLLLPRSSTRRIHKYIECICISNISSWMTYTHTHTHTDSSSVNLWCTYMLFMFADHFKKSSPNHQEKNTLPS